MSFMPISTGMNPLEAYASLMRFAQHRGEQTLKLAMHGAVPQVFRAELLHLLKLNFVPDAPTDFTSEADILLAEFCIDIGNGYFQLDPEVRLLLLHDLDATYPESPKSRVVYVAEFLIKYVRYSEQSYTSSQSRTWWNYIFMNEWVSLSFLDSDIAAEQLATALSQTIDASDSIGKIQVGGLANALSSPLAKHHELLTYAMGIQLMEAGQSESAQELFQSIGKEEIVAGRVRLRVPRSTLREIPTEISRHLDFQDIISSPAASDFKISEGQRLELFALISNIADDEQQWQKVLDIIQPYFKEAFAGGICLYRDKELLNPEYFPTNRADISYSLALKALRNRQSFIWVRELSDDEVNDLKTSEVQQAIYTPILRGSTRLGVIYMHTKSIFTDDDLSLLSAISEIIAGNEQFNPETAHPRLPNLYISYSHEDKEFVDQLSLELRRQRISVWYDDRLRAGAEWQNQLTHAIQSSTAVAIVMSPNSMSSDYVRWDIEQARTASKIIIPLLYKDCDIPDYLSRFQYIDVQKDFGSGTLELVDELYELTPVEAVIPQSSDNNAKNKTRILFLAANPSNADPLRLSEEIRTIHESIRGGQYRDQFDTIQQWAVSYSDLERLLLEHQPHIIHLSAHGSRDRAIALEDNTGNVAMLSGETLKLLLRAVTDGSSGVKCVFLNGCYDVNIANTIVDDKRCVLGTSRGVTDAGTIEFASSFYRALTYGRSVRGAFNLATAALSFLSERETPQLITQGTYADDLVFVDLKNTDNTQEQIVVELPDDEVNLTTDDINFEKLLATDLDRALQVANSIEDVKTRSDLLIQIATELAKQNLDHAIAVAYSIEYVVGRTTALVKIAQEIIEPNRLRAIQILQEALSLMDTLEDKSQVSDLRNLAVSLVAHYPNISLSEYLKNTRDKYDLTQAQLAEIMTSDEARVHQRDVSTFEYGGRSPKRESIILLVRYLIEQGELSSIEEIQSIFEHFEYDPLASSEIQQLDTLLKTDSKTVGQDLASILTELGWRSDPYSFDFSETIQLNNNSLMLDCALKKNGILFAFISIKSEHDNISITVEQAEQATVLLGVKFGYVTNGSQIVEIDATTDSRRTIARYRTPAELEKSLQSLKNNSDSEQLKSIQNVSETDKITLDYESVARFAQSIGEDAYQVNTLLHDLQNSVDELCSVGWLGSGADAFNSEMHDKLLPRIQRYTSSLESLSAVLNRVSTLFQNAESEALKVWESSQDEK